MPGNQAQMLTPRIPKRMLYDLYGLVDTERRSARAHAIRQSPLMVAPDRSELRTLTPLPYREFSVSLLTY